MSRLRPILPALLAALGLSPVASAQVAFVPQVSSFPNGVMLGTTPVVSSDRRYVRMTINPRFTALEGFDTYSVPGAVSGGGGGPGALRGLLGGGGLRNVAVPGPTFAAGMDGLIPPGSAVNDWRFNPDASTLISGFDGFPERSPLTRGFASPSRSKVKAARLKALASKAKRPLAVNPPSPATHPRLP